MDTPICLFLEKYASENNIRLHMPGHKGVGGLSERYDLTEIDGADSLYEASGIIKQSESNASTLYGSYTLYSTEGSSLAIRAMLYLAVLSRTTDERPIVLAARNAHKVFASAAALLDFDIDWLVGSDSSYLSSAITKEDVAKKIDAMDKKPLAVYITSPDYLGNVADISGIAVVCHARGVLLLVDNAHGAYLAFTEPSQHPIALGADMCTDSAHKTLPCLTGAAYLHLSNSVPEGIKARAKTALALFGSTSPSYLILASLDKANSYLSDGYKDKLSSFTNKLCDLRTRLQNRGYTVIGNEPMKLTLSPKSYGYSGIDIAKVLTVNGIVPEFCDPDFLVLMPTPEMGDEELRKTENVLLSLEKREAICDIPPALVLPKSAMSVREAILSQSETVKIEDAIGRILADITVGCPPAVPIVVSGEQIHEDTVEVFKYYGITHCSVVKNT